jgi:hypothetical protein
MMDIVMDADTYMILDVDSGNSLGIFEDWESASSTLAQMVEGMPYRADSMALVAFDKTGFALDTVFADGKP